MTNEVRWDLGPYENGFYRIITPTDEPFQARVVAFVPKLEDARVILAWHNNPLSAASEALLQAAVEGAEEYAKSAVDSRKARAAQREAASSEGENDG